MGTQNAREHAQFLYFFKITSKLIRMLIYLNIEEDMTYKLHVVAVLMDPVQKLT